MHIDLPDVTDPKIIADAADAIGVQLEGWNNGRRLRNGLIRIEGLRLRPAPGDAYRAHRGTFDGTLGARKGTSICWHGHREWMRKVYAAEPSAIIASSRAKYEGSGHFEDIHEDTRPDYRIETCRCED